MVDLGGEGSMVACQHVGDGEGSDELSEDMAPIAEQSPRDVVLAVLSHDLRNLIASMTLNLDLLARGWAGVERRSAGRRQVDATRRVVMHMAELVATLLDSAGRPIRLEPHDPADVAREVVEVMELDARRAGLRLSTNLAAHLAVSCDRPRIRQVLTNLVGNAVKFTSTGGSIHVAVRATETGACFSVSDTGPGILPEEIPRIFERSYRAGRREKPGLGLGLWIAHEIVAGHRGRIWVESEPGLGSTFFVELARP